MPLVRRDPDALLRHLETLAPWWVGDLPVDELEALRRRISLLHARSGDRLTHAHANARSLWMVLQGTVQGSLWGDGELLHYAWLTPGTLAGEEAVVSPGPSRFALRVAERSLLACLDHRDHQALQAEAPIASGRLTSRLAATLAVAIRQTHQAFLEDAGAITPRTLWQTPVDPVDPVAHATATMPRPAEHGMHAANIDRLLQTLDGLGVFRPQGRHDPEAVRALRDHIRDIAPAIGVQVHLADEVITRQAARPDGLYVLLSGTVRSELHVRGSVHDRDEGTLAMLRVRQPGEVFGILGFCDGHGAATTHRALGSATVAVLQPAAVRQLMDAAVSGAPHGLRFLDWITTCQAQELRQVTDLYRAQRAARSACEPVAVS